MNELVNVNDEFHLQTLEFLLGRVVDGKRILSRDKRLDVAQPVTEVAIPWYYNYLYCSRHP